MRNYIVASWNDADQYDYSGQMVGNRQSKSQKVHFNPDGSACTASYADPTDKSIRKTSIPLRDRIIPQERRLLTIDTQIEELNQEYNSNRMYYQEYTQLKTILDKKRARAWELYVKAGGVVQESVEEGYLPIESAYETNNSHSANSVCGVGIIDDLSDENCLKVFLQKACKGYKLAVHYKYKAATYVQSLKDL